MKKVEELKQAVSALDAAELSALLAWFQEYLADKWDAQIGEDAAAGRLDTLADEALAAGRTGQVGPAPPARPGSFLDGVEHLVGGVGGGPQDLSTNSRHMDSFGR